MLLLNIFKKAPGVVISASFLIIFSLFSLNSVASDLFPLYYIYVAAGVVLFVLFSLIDFSVISLFSKHLYVLSLILLLTTLVIGQVTRGAVRWIPLGPISIQSTEFVRPFLILFFADFLIGKRINIKKIAQTIGLFAVPAALILIQPSLGVTILTSVGFLGVILASEIDKKALATLFILGLAISPLSWFLLAPYQKARISSFLTPAADPSGSGYNSLQAMISVGSGQLTGRGFGKGVQTQLQFLPEKHSDFIFASVSEEMGFLGASILLVFSFLMLYFIIKSAERSFNPTARAFITGVFLSLFVQTVIHVGMNMGLLPITGLPLPLVSAGGSSLVATMMSLGMVVSAVKQ